MRINIWIPKDLEESIRVEAYNNKQSVSGYLVGLHCKEKEGLLRDNFRSKINIQDCEGNEIKVYDGKGKIGSISNAKMYSDEYRKKNPQESCKVCGKALKFNCGH